MRGRSRSSPPLCCVEFLAPPLEIRLPRFKRGAGSVEAGSPRVFRARVSSAGWPLPAWPEAQRRVRAAEPPPRRRCRRADGAGTVLAAVVSVAEAHGRIGAAHEIRGAQATLPAALAFRSRSRSLALVSQRTTRGSSGLIRSRHVQP